MPLLVYKPAYNSPCIGVLLGLANASVPSIKNTINKTHSSLKWNLLASFFLLSANFEESVVWI